MITTESTGKVTNFEKGQAAVKCTDAAKTASSNTRDKWRKVVDTSEIDYSLGAVNLALDKASVGLASIESYALELRSLMTEKGRQENGFTDGTLNSLLLSIYVAMDYTNEARKETESIYRTADLR